MKKHTPYSIPCWFLILSALLFSACQKPGETSDEQEQTPEPTQGETISDTEAMEQEESIVSEPTVAPEPKPEPKPKHTEADYYVSPDGNDSQEGSFKAPFRTIQKAANIAKAGEIVAIRAGVYRETVRPAHSGRPDAPISFVAYGDETPVISGTDIITNWEAHDDDLYSATVERPFKSAINQAMQVFADGIMLSEARSPNSMEIIHYPLHTVKEVLKQEEIGKNHYRITFTSEGFQEPQGTWDNATISIRPMWKWGWGMPRTGNIIESGPGKLTIEMENYEYAEGDTSTIVRAGSPFYVFGSVKGLDAPGEWYFHDQSRKLGLILPERTNPNEHTIEYKARDYAFDLSERHDILIRGFDIFAATITTDNKAGSGIPEFHPHSEIRKETIAPAKRITLDGLNVKYPSHFTDLRGYVLSQWLNNTGIILSGSNHVLQNSYIGYSAGNGVTVIGENSKVFNNVIYVTSYQGAETAGINFGSWATMSRDHEAYHNTIYTTGGNGIYANALHSSDPEKKQARIHHNLVNDYGLRRVDIGAVYSSGGRHAHVVLHHNFFYGAYSSQTYGIYLDYQNEWVMHHNVVAEVPWASCLHSNGRGSLNQRYFHNTLLGLSQAVNGQNRGPAEGAIYQNNIFMGDVLDNAAELKNNYKLANPNEQKQLFKDAARHDFRLREGTPPVDNAVVVEPWTGDIKGSAPDQGAYELGQALIEYGASLPPVVAAPTNLQAERQEDGSVLLTWEDNADNEQSYIVQRGIKESMFIGNINWETLATLTPNSTSYTDPGKPKGNIQDGKVYYVVRSPDAPLSNLAIIPVR